MIFPRSDACALTAMSLTAIMEVRIFGRVLVAVLAVRLAVVRAVAWNTQPLHSQRLRIVRMMSFSFRSLAALLAR